MDRAVQNRPQLRSLSLSIDSQARDVFFAYYITDTPNCWDFVSPWYHCASIPDYLNAAIETVALAYLWHQVLSEIALTAARKRYISALRMLRNALNSPNEALEETSLLAVLLLDLFEKITHIATQSSALLTTHVNGALALVKIRGLERFQGPHASRILVRFHNHYMASHLVTGSSVPEDLLSIRAYATQHLRVPDYTLRSHRPSHAMQIYGTLSRSCLLPNVSCVHYSSTSSWRRQYLRHRNSGSIRQLM